MKLTNTGDDVAIVRVARYSRTSTNRQEKEGTIESQNEQVFDYVKQHYPYIKQEDIIIFEDDGWSGSTLERPGMDELLASLPDDTWDVLVIPDPDRLARDPYLQLFVIDEIKKAGKSVQFCTTKAPDSNNEDDLMMFEMRGMMSKYEKMRINSRFRTGKLRKAKKHVMLSEAPYGYTLVKKYENAVTGAKTQTHILINKKEAAIVKLIFNWYVHDKLSMRQIAARLKDIGAKPRKNKNGDWSVSTLGNMLGNTTYTGEARYRQTEAIEPVNPIRKLNKEPRRDKKTSRRMRPQEQWMKVTVPAVFDSKAEKDLFELAQEQRKKNARLNPRNRKNKYLLGGLVYCTCGFARTGEGPQKGRYLYYRCGGRHNNQTTGCKKCELKGVNSRIADSAVWDILLKLLTERRYLRTQLGLYYAKKDNNQSDNTKIEHLQTAVDKLNKRIIELKQFVLDDQMSVSQYTELRSDADVQLSSNQVKISELTKKQERNEKNLVTPEEFELILEDSAMQLHSLNFTQKQAIVGQLIDEVVAEPGQLTVTGHIGLSSASDIQELEGTYYSSKSQENHVKHKTIGRNCWSTQRWKINFI